MARYVAGDLQAFDELYARVRPRVFKYLAVPTFGMSMPAPDHARAAAIAASAGLVLVLVGAAAGCLAGSAVGIACGSVELGHLLVGHGLIVPLLAGVGALMARRALAP